jgi:hypothetical protein
VRFRSCSLTNDLSVGALTQVNRIGSLDKIGGGVDRGKGMC